MQRELYKINPNPIPLFLHRVAWLLSFPSTFKWFNFVFTRTPNDPRSSSPRLISNITNRESSICERKGKYGYQVGLLLENWKTCFSSQFHQFIRLHYYCTDSLRLLCSALTRIRSNIEMRVEKYEWKLAPQYTINQRVMCIVPYAAFIPVRIAQPVSSHHAVGSRLTRIETSAFNSRRFGIQKVAFSISKANVKTRAQRSLLWKHFHWPKLAPAQYHQPYAMSFQAFA